MLPKIDDFFGVRVDELIDVNGAKKEEEIPELIFNYDNIYNDNDEKHKAFLK